MPLCPSDTSVGSGRRIVDSRRIWEGTRPPKPLIWLASVALTVTAAVALGLFDADHADMRAFFMEDGPVETLQAGLLVGVAGLFSIGFARSAGARSLFCLLAAYACIFAVTREIPRCGSTFAGGDVCLTSGWKQAVVLLASALGIAAFLSRPVDWRTALRPSNLRWTWPCLIVVGFLVAAEGLEHLIYYSDIEEWMELAAYLHLGAMALSILWASRET